MTQEFFMIGSTNIYDYQEDGFKRWNTWSAAKVQSQTGMDQATAQRHVDQRGHMDSLKCTLCGGSWHLAKDCRWRRS